MWGHQDLSPAPAKVQTQEPALPDGPTDPVADPSVLTEGGEPQIWGELPSLNNGTIRDHTSQNHESVGGRIVVTKR